MKALGCICYSTTNTKTNTHANAHSCTHMYMRTHKAFHKHTPLCITARLFFCVVVFSIPIGENDNRSAQNYSLWLVPAKAPSQKK